MKTLRWDQNKLSTLKKTPVQPNEWVCASNPLLLPLLPALTLILINHDDVKDNRELQKNTRYGEEESTFSPWDPHRQLPASGRTHGTCSHCGGEDRRVRSQGRRGHGDQALEPSKKEE